MLVFTEKTIYGLSSSKKGELLSGPLMEPLMCSGCTRGFNRQTGQQFSSDIRSDCPK